VKLKLVEPFSGTLAAPNALMITGGPTTVMLAFDVLPVPPLVDVTCTLLFFTPVVVPVIFNETVQEAPGARLAPLRLVEEDPATAVAVPLHVEFRFDGVATTNPAGKLSVKAIPLNVKFASGLVTVKVRLVVPFSGTVVAPNALRMVGGFITVRFAEAVFPLPASDESIVTLLLKTPSVVPCTFTVIKHVPTGRVAFAKLIVPAPAVAVIVPPHPLTTLGVVATTKLAGRLSVKLESMATVFPFVMANVTLLGAFTATVVGLKLLVIEGGCRITIPAVTVC